MDYATIASPLIIGAASVIAFVSIRATSISDRIRTAVHESIATDTPPERRKNLIGQLRGLKRRYSASTYALLFLLLSFASFVTMAALNAASRHSAAAAFAVGFTFGVLGFLLTLYEVLTSSRTLFADTRYAEQVFSETAPLSADPH